MYCHQPQQILFVLSVLDTCFSCTDYLQAWRYSVWLKRVLAIFKPYLQAWIWSVWLKYALSSGLRIVSTCFGHTEYLQAWRQYMFTLKHVSNTDGTNKICHDWWQYTHQFLIWLYHNWINSKKKKKKTKINYTLIPIVHQQTKCVHPYCLYKTVCSIWKLWGWVNDEENGLLRLFFTALSTAE
jgi:hypothetical protein